MKQIYQKLLEGKESKNIFVTCIFYIFKLQKPLMLQGEFILNFRSKQKNILHRIYRQILENNANCKIAIEILYYIFDFLYHKLNKESDLSYFGTDLRDKNDLISIK